MWIKKELLWLKTLLHAICSQFIQKMYRHGPDLSTGLHGLHHVTPFLTIKSLLLEKNLSIQKLIIKNFKGINNREEFEIRPITIFCGPNSSGKSSCIHALAALAQTTKLSASQMPIVLDDEYAHVHLGRFMDVIHSKDAKDSFSIGVVINNPEKIIPNIKSDKKDDVYLQAEYSFKARSSTQEVYIQSASMTIGADSSKFERLKISGPEFSVHKSGKKMPFTATAVGRFSIQVRPTFEKGKSNQDEMDTFFSYGKCF